MSDKYSEKWEPVVQEYQLQKQINSLLTYAEFCKNREISAASLSKAMKFFGIKSEARGGKITDPNRHRTLNLYKFDGNMLGDGSLLYSCKNKDRYPCYSHSCKYLDYIEWLTQNTELLQNRPIWTRSYFDKRTSKSYTCYWTKSLSSLFLKEQLARWYPDGTKKIPEDLQMNEEVLLHWYLDDGSLASKGGIYFAADDSSFDEAEEIRSKVENFLNLKVTIHVNDGNPRLYIRSRDTKEFLAIIGDCPVPSYMYKWGG